MAVTPKEFISFPGWELSMQMLADRNAYSSETGDTPYFCISSIPKNSKFVVTSTKDYILGAVTYEIVVNGCRVNRTRRRSICKKGEKCTLETFKITFNTETYKITSIAPSAVSFSKGETPANFNSTTIFDETLASDSLPAMKGKYLCRKDNPLPRYYLHASGTSLMYLVRKACMTSEPTKGPCTCSNPSSYSVNIIRSHGSNSNLLQNVEPIDVPSSDPMFNVFTKTLSSSKSYSFSYLDKKTWFNFGYVCYSVYDSSKTIGSNGKAEFVFHGCRYQRREGISSSNGMCKKACMTERIRMKVTYNNEFQRVTGLYMESPLVYRYGAGSS